MDLLRGNYIMPSPIPPSERSDLEEDKTKKDKEKLEPEDPLSPLSMEKKPGKETKGFSVEDLDELFWDVYNSIHADEQDSQLKEKAQHAAQHGVESSAQPQAMAMSDSTLDPAEALDQSDFYETLQQNSQAAVQSATLVAENVAELGQAAGPLLGAG